MPRRSVRNRRRSLGCLTFAIGALVVIAAGLVCAIVLTDRLPVSVDEPTPTVDGGTFVDANDLPQSEMVLTAGSFDEAAARATPVVARAASTPSPSPTPTLDPNDPYAALRPMPSGENMLPVFSRANTDEKVIAITLDECAGAEMTGRFAEVANSYGAKLTLFPTGENLMKTGMAQLMKKCLYEYGYEIENRGYTAASKVFQYTSDLLVQEIWKQSIALNFVLGVKYQPHFYRMYGGLGEADPRTHAYLKQQGYIGVAHWTVAASNVDVYEISNKLTPGGIYQFRSNAEDGMRMIALMQAANSQGYPMVTLNELFGYAPNEYHQVEGSLLSETMPVFRYDDSALYNLYPGDASWAVAKMQSRLIYLGYLAEGGADGIFGQGTSDALRMFQAQTSHAAAGVADVATQKLLYAADAPKNPNPLIDFGSAQDGQLLEDSLVPDGGEPDGEDLLEEDLLEEELLEEELEE